MLLPIAIFVVSEAIVASKQPQRSDLTLKWSSVTLITYVSMSMSKFYGAILWEAIFLLLQKLSTSQ